MLFHLFISFRFQRTDAVNLYKNFEVAIKKLDALLGLFKIEYGEAERNKKTVPGKFFLLNFGR